ncbi:glycosyltransferase [Candidatus Micrarchaeota archaeon]|nr:glycosyltransferase [Candidatus Micrarchaeota archaeon]
MNSQRISKEKFNRIIAIVPVYNEAQNLHDVLNPLIDMIAKGKIDNVIAINDGSIDNSQKELEVYLENPGFINMVLPKNYGKSYAFYCAAKASYQMGADVILILDADLVDISENQIDLLVSPILTQPEINMTIGTVDGCSLFCSGQRALRATALAPILDEKQIDIKWEYIVSGVYTTKTGKKSLRRRVGYGLEWALNDYIEQEFLFMTDFSDYSKKIFKHIYKAKTNFYSRVPSFYEERYGYTPSRAQNLNRETIGIITKLKKHFGIEEPGFF